MYQPVSCAPPPPMTGPAPAIDAIVPVHAEHPAALFATLQACLAQTRRIGTVYVVDDGSPDPVRLPADLADSGVVLVRLDMNRGIAAARNAALRESRSELVACVNVEVLPRPDWLEKCAAVMRGDPSVGACFTPTEPLDPGALLTRWRYRFQELALPESDGPTDIAIGHAVLFRRAALDEVGGYDESFRRILEDADVCQRMTARGWRVHFLTSTACTSIQPDSLLALARKELIRSGDDPAAPLPFGTLSGRLTRLLATRLARNLWRRRFSFLPVDVAVWGVGLVLAARRRPSRGARPR